MGGRPEGGRSPIVGGGQPAAYHEDVTNPTRPDEPEPQWRQPPFEPPADEASSPPVSGELLLPANAAPPPSLAESTLRVVAGVVWPIMIALAIFGIGGWVGNILIAIITSVVLGKVGEELRRRRKSAYRLPPAPGAGDLR